MENENKRMEIDQADVDMGKRLQGLIELELGGRGFVLIWERPNKCDGVLTNTDPKSCHKILVNVAKLIAEKPPNIML
jgi:hypothetical protein